MVGLIAFHILMLALGLGVAGRIVAPRLVASLLSYLHKSIGISTPAPNQVRVVALIWIGCLVATVDGFLFVLLFLTNMSHAR
jgi:F0F1-type ATP synthase membrane subunit a